MCLIISVYLFIQFFRYRRAVTDSKERLRKYNANTAWLSYGKMTYIDRGNGETVLSVHGFLAAMIRPMKVQYCLRMNTE